MLEFCPWGIAVIPSVVLLAGIWKRKLCCVHWDSLSVASNIHLQVYLLSQKTNEDWAIHWGPDSAWSIDNGSVEGWPAPLILLHIGISINYCILHVLFFWGGEVETQLWLVVSSPAWSSSQRSSGNVTLIIQKMNRGWMTHCPGLSNKSLTELGFESQCFRWSNPPTQRSVILSFRDIGWHFNHSCAGLPVPGLGRCSYVLKNYR